LETGREILKRPTLTICIERPPHKMTLLGGFLADRKMRGQKNVHGVRLFAYLQRQSAATPKDQE
jgi:hypothetical protein